MRREPAPGREPAEGAQRLDAMRRLGRAMAEPSRSRILVALLPGPATTAALARALGMSRTTARRALARLDRDGLVLLEPGRPGRASLADPRLAEAIEALRDAVVVVDPAIEGRVRRPLGGERPPLEGESR